MYRQVRVWAAMAKKKKKKKERNVEGTQVIAQEYPHSVAQSGTGLGDHA